MNHTDNDVPKIRYFKLPYLGKNSEGAQKKINFLLKKFCKNSLIKLAFTTCKSQNYFSTKDKVPKNLNSMWSMNLNVVYEFKCAGCNSCYIGETHRHLHVRIDEHLRNDKKSHVYMF